MRGDDQTNDQDDRSGRKYQDHREDVLEDPVLACYPLPFLQRDLGLGRMIAGRRIVQVESSAAPAQVVAWVPARATNPNHHASAALPPLCGQCSAVQNAQMIALARTSAARSAPFSPLRASTRQSGRLASWPVFATLWM
jgi:hypothetical protein